MRDIFTIGGLHGNEPLGIEVVEKLETLNHPQIKALFGNPEAIKQNKRFIEEDLNRVFPGDPNGSLEARRAVEIMEQVQGFDLVFDFHNTTVPNNDCAFVGESNYEALLPIVKQLGFSRVVIADYDCVNKYVSNCISVECSLDSPLNDPESWVDRLTAISEDRDTGVEPDSLTCYKFARRVTKEEQDKWQFKDWEVFTPISTKDAETLDLDTSREYMPIFINDTYTPYNFAGLITEMK